MNWHDMVRPVWGNQRRNWLRIPLTSGGVTTGFGAESVGSFSTGVQKNVFAALAELDAFAEICVLPRRRRSVAGGRPLRTRGPRRSPTA